MQSKRLLRAVYLRNDLQFLETLLTFLRFNNSTDHLWILDASDSHYLDNIQKLQDIYPFTLLHSESKYLADRLSLALNKLKHSEAKYDHVIFHAVDDCLIIDSGSEFGDAFIHPLRFLYATEISRGINIRSKTLSSLSWADSRHMNRLDLMKRAYMNNSAHQRILSSFDCNYLNLVFGCYPANLFINIFTYWCLIHNRIFSEDPEYVQSSFYSLLFELCISFLVIILSPSIQIFSPNLLALFNQRPLSQGSLMSKLEKYPPQDYIELNSSTKIVRLVREVLRENINHSSYDVGVLFEIYLASFKDAAELIRSHSINDRLLYEGRSVVDSPLEWWDSGPQIQQLLKLKVFLKSFDDVALTQLKKTYSISV